MSLVLLDTSTILTPGFFTEYSERIGNGEFRSSMIARGEIVFGLQKAQASGDDSKVKRNRAILKALDRPKLEFWIPYGVAESESYGLIAAPISLIAGAKARSKDALIAATAHANNMAIMTYNKSDFDMFRDHVEVVSP